MQPSNVNPHLDPRLFDIANLPQAIQAEPSGVNNLLERPPIEVDGDILEPDAVRTTNLVALNWVEPLNYIPFSLRSSRRCEHCNAILFQGETNAICCSKGTITLPSPAPPPALLNILKESTSSISGGRHFIDNIRLFNSNFAFTSIGVKIDTSLENAQRGVYTFKVNGVFHYRLGSLNPYDGIPKFLQLYIFHSQNKLENRHRWGDHLSRELTQTLQDILHQNNPFIIQFKHLALENNLTTKAISLND